METKPYVGAECRGWVITTVYPAMCEHTNVDCRTGVTQLVEARDETYLAEHDTEGGWFLTAKEWAELLAATK